MLSLSYSWHVHNVWLQGRINHLFHLSLYYFFIYCCIVLIFQYEIKVNQPNASKDMGLIKVLFLIKILFWISKLILMWSDDWNYYNKLWWRFKHFIFIKVTDQAGTIEEGGVIIDQPKSSKDGGMIKVLTLILFHYKN